MSEPTADERARVSAPVLRTFLNVADRWELSRADRLALLDADERQFEEWSSVARSHGPLALKTAVLMRISAVLGVFAELKQLFGSAHQERAWLTRAHRAAAFGGRAPLDLLRSSLEEQLAVRLYAFGIGRSGSLPEIDPELLPVRAPNIIWEVARPLIQAVCFDGFGTLVDIRDKRRPFKALLGDDPTPELVHRTLTTPTSLRGLVRDLSLAADEATLSALEASLEAELSSTRLRFGVEVLWEALRNVGLRVGVCSNLATPYEHALIGCLPRVPDAMVLSFRVGLRKPQPEMFQRVCVELNLQPSRVLFVGDNLEADVLGPQRAGLFAMHIDEFETALAQGPAPGTLGALAELIERIAEFSRAPRARLLHSPEEALDSGLLHVNVRAMIKHDRNQLLHVLRSPSAVMAGDDPVLKHLLCIFIDETDEALLIRIAEGTEIGWAELVQAAHAALPSGSPKLAWIAAREVMSVASRP